MNSDFMTSWIISLPVLVISTSIFLWWLVGQGEKRKTVCMQCGEPMISENHCNNCGSKTGNPF